MDSNENMKNYKLVSLGDVVKSITNGTTAKQNKECSGYRVTRIETISNGNINIIKTNFVKLNQNLYNKFLLDEGNILFSHINSTKHLGKTAIYTPDMGELIHGMNLLRIVPDKSVIIPKFLLYLLKNRKSRAYFQTRCKKAVNQSSLDQKTIKKFKLILPPLETQKKIVEILEKTEKLKHWRSEADELADEYFKSVFISIFGDPGKNPNDWEQKTLGEVCHTIKDGPHVSPKYVEDGIPFISVNNIIKGYWDLENVRYVSYEDHKKFTKKCKPEKGDVLYTKGGTTGFAKYIDIDLEFSNWVHLAVLKFDKKEINGIFLEHMLNSNYCYQQSQVFTRGIANRDLVINQMKRIKVFVPSIKLQNQFADIVQQVETLKSYQSQSKQQIDNLFNTLMQKAFKGELVC